jgi:predicted RNase H-like HicB family nuclease/CBS domain-containing protein
MKHKRYTARIEYSKKDNCLIGRVANIRDIITFHGNSTEEIEENFKKAVDFYLETEPNPQEPDSKCIKGNSLFPDQAVYFRNQFREARTKAFQDSESFSEILFAIERLGSYLIGEISTLDDYRSCIQTLAKNSPLAEEIPKEHPNSHIKIDRLYELVMQARNDALHQGAYARHLTSRSIELSLVLEDALMSNGKLVRDYMIINPVCADLWQPLSFIRQQMLANSFSFLPVRDSDKCWNLVSDQALAQYLRVKKAERDKRMAQTLEKALGETKSVSTLNLEKDVITVKATEGIDEVMQKISNHCPILVTIDGTKTGELIGILTSFDLL